MLALQEARRPRVSTEDWDYRTADTKQVTHGIHAYPAMMIPQIAQRLVETYGREGILLFDPYCGSGTTLLEGMLAGMVAKGTDLNPLARLIARVKTTPASIHALDSEIDRLPPIAPTSDIPIPDVPNVDYWFSPEVQRDLAALRKHIDGICDPTLADVFRVAFSITVRKVSWTRKSEFKLYRIPECEIDAYDANTFLVMRDAVNDIRNALARLAEVVVDVDRPVVHDFNTVDGIPNDALAPDSVDLVVTSPPYGDSRTTVAYGQFCRLSSQWLGYSEARQVDNMLMGGGKIDSRSNFGFDELDIAIEDIAEVDECRAREVASFFADYRASIRNVAAIVRPGGHACYVVGNRTVKGRQVPTAEATAAFFEENGFKTVETCTRNIPNKRMPAVNSPTNIRGKIGKTMTTEQIVICKKAA